MSASSDTLPRLLLDNVEVRGSLPAMREKYRGIWRTTTWQNLSDDVQAIALALMAGGSRPGDAIAVLSANGLRLTTAISAALAVGAVAVPLDPDASAAELLPLLQSAQVTHVFAQDQEQVDKLLAILAELPSIRLIIYDRDRGLRQYRQPQLMPFDNLLQQGRGLVASHGPLLKTQIARTTTGDTAALFFTSGTTGPAKGVLFTHAALIDRARAAAALDGQTDADTVLAFLPMAWLGQFQLAYVQPLLTGHCVCCPESAETLFSDMREIGPTFLLAPPRIYENIAARAMRRMENSGGARGLYRSAMALGRRVGGRILSRRKTFFGARLAYAAGNALIYAPLRNVLGLSRLRAAYTSGDAISPATLSYFHAIGVNLKQLYGSTESGFLVAAQRSDEVMAGNVGRATQGVELRLSPEREILVRSPGLFREYLHDAAASRQAMTEDGWFRTGDIGALDPDGQLRIIDRLADASGGGKHPVKPLESHIRSSPYIAHALIFSAGKSDLCALIDIDAEAMGDWADRRALAYTGHADLTALDAVRQLVADWLAAINREAGKNPDVAGPVRRFVILPEALDADDGVLTRLGKVRREAVAKRYSAVIEAMAAGHKHASLTSAGPGQSTLPPLDLAIHDVAAAPAREAA